MKTEVEYGIEIKNFFIIFLLETEIMSDYNVLSSIISKDLDQALLTRTSLFYVLIAVVLGSIFLAVQQQLRNTLSYHTEAQIRRVIGRLSFVLLCSELLGRSLYVDMNYPWRFIRMSALRHFAFLSKF